MVFSPFFGVIFHREIKVVDFACGEHHVICLTADGYLYEWGDRSWLEPHRVLSPQVEDEERKFMNCWMWTWVDCIETRWD